MQKRRWIVCALVLCLLAAGCTKRDGGAAPETDAPADVQTAEPTGEPTANPAALQPPMPRVDVDGNPIETGYAEGTLSEITEDTIVVDEAGEAHTFTLSERAKSDLTALELGAGTRIIVNFSPAAEDGYDEAVSLEKIIVE